MLFAVVGVGVFDALLAFEFESECGVPAPPPLRHDSSQEQEVLDEADGGKIFALVRVTSCAGAELLFLQTRSIQVSTVLKGPQVHRCPRHLLRLLHSHLCRPHRLLQG